MPSSISKKPAAKKTTFSDRQYVEQDPKEDDIAVKEEARYLPIDVVERDLDRWAWGTQNFAWTIYTDTSRRAGIAASLELVIPWKDDKGIIIERKLVGSCNFSISSYAPNSHFVATAKSECVKNAASDLGKRFGRGLNEGLQEQQADPALVETPKGKIKPEKFVLAAIKKAQEEGDQATLANYLKIYEINPEENGNETI